MFHLKVLIVKLRLVVYTKAAGAVTPHKVATLHHELRDSEYQPCVRRRHSDAVFSSCVDVQARKLSCRSCMRTHDSHTMKDSPLITLRLHIHPVLAST